MRDLPKHTDPIAFRAISKAGFDLNARDHQGLPPLLTLEISTWSNDWKEDNFSTEAYRKMFKILKNAGMDISITDPAGRTILHLLIEDHARKLSTLELFLELGCNSLARDHRGATVLHYFIRRSSNIPK
jgi:ankyrin repeat protein